ncbi:hypothetical protein CPSG_05029 [Coccidioides posadasii str. Silveira]|uniref:Uncharacterized protein n=1 Tax=Coccidioides posadasii (strain RMSCC 757 / Silveira) TaxID=443226 RepID=E9D5Z9_COCPS|nr:hypothetical protein CPSG_05029 [Coccidioides posadasii str. Silveira]
MSGMTLSFQRDFQALSSVSYSPAFPSFLQRLRVLPLYRNSRRCNPWLELMSASSVCVCPNKRWLHTTLEHGPDRNILFKNCFHISSPSILFHSENFIKEKLDCPQVVQVVAVGGENQQRLVIQSDFSIFKCLRTHLDHGNIVSKYVPEQSKIVG